MKKKILLLLFLGICFASFVSATCQTDNAFEPGEDFNICSGRCKYELTSGNFVDCNASVSCYLSMTYPNGTFVGFFEEMEFNADGNEIYNYSFGNSTNFPAGTYSGQINCFWEKGWSDPINFEADISFVSEGYVAGTGGKELPITLNSLDIDYKDEWCFDLEYTITVKPLDLDEEITEIDGISYYSGMNFLQTGGAYERNLTYYITFYPDSTKINYTEKDVVIKITASQSGKIIKEDLEIHVKECTELTKTIKNITIKIEDFWRKYWILISIISLMLLIIVLFVILLKRTKRKQ